MHTPCPFKPLPSVLACICLAATLGTGARADNLPVRCEIEAVELHFPALSLLDPAPQAGEGAVRFRCDNRSAQPHELRLTLTDAQPQPHALGRNRVGAVSVKAHAESNGAAPRAEAGGVVLDLYVDPQRSRRLAGDAQDRLTTISWPVSLAPGASTVQRIPVYPTVTLPAGPVAAGDYSQQATVRLFVEARSP